MNSRIDIIIVTAGMIIGFSIILMHLTGMWPCTIITKLDKLFLTNNSNSLSLTPSQGLTGEWTFQNFIKELHYLLTNLFRCK